MARTTKKHMSQEDMKHWDDLYMYVKTRVLGYDENQSLSKNMVLRLKGLLTNKFMANNHIEDTANYSYQVVLNTFKFCNPSIQKGLKNNAFTDENHKFAYILKIVESNLNNVYIKMRDAEKAKEEIDNHDISYTANYNNTFKSKENKQNNSKKYEDLW